MATLVERERELTAIKGPLERPRSPAGDIPPTGRPVRVDYIQVLHFRDGKHAPFNLMFDRLLMLEQLGLMPSPDAA